MAFENEAGSLTAEPGERPDEPWMVWLNGGLVHILLVGVAPTRVNLLSNAGSSRPGTSSLYGLFSEHGPLHFGLAEAGADPSTVFNDTSTPPLSYAITENPYSWHRLASIFYIDQPVGTG
jgi:carboxypeptidase D